MGGNFLRKRRQSAGLSAIGAEEDESASFETEAEIYSDDRDRVVSVSDKPEKI